MKISDCVFMTIEYESVGFSINIINTSKKSSFYKHLNGVHELMEVISNMCFVYSVEQIFIDTRGFGLAIYDIYDKIRRLLSPNISIMLLNCSENKLREI